MKLILDITTVPYKVLRQLAKHPPGDVGMQRLKKIQKKGRKSPPHSLLNGDPFRLSPFWQLQCKYPVLITSPYSSGINGVGKGEGAAEGTI